MESRLLNFNMFSNIIDFVKAFYFTYPAEFLRFLPEFNNIPCYRGITPEDLINSITNSEYTIGARAIEILLALLSSGIPTNLPLNVILEAFSSLSDIKLRDKNLISRFSFIQSLFGDDSIPDSLKRVLNYLNAFGEGVSEGYGFENPDWDSNQLEQAVENSRETYLLETTIQELNSEQGEGTSNINTNYDGSFPDEDYEGKGKGKSIYHNID